MTEVVKEIRIIKDGALKVNGKLELKELHLLAEDIESDLRQMTYTGQALVLDSRVENSKLPPIINSFYLYVFEKCPNSII